MRISENDMLELIAFTLGDQEFCIEVVSVREIRSWTPATMLPHSPDHVRGVINLRGAVLPVMDLALRLGLAPAEPSQGSVIIVTQIGSQIVGLLVDLVSDIFTISAEEIHPAPDVSKTMDREQIRGMIPMDDRMICFLQLNALFGAIESEAA
ncbi:chemotaxis protein CheW [uncultured Hoeflea sp.]|uniref:chemotaxis protein CheW n=1 Tax=uncultured Hoeflea sp. TaxID=538666 RepID=UPI0030EEE35F|tara:strand:- start:15124 stop:15579 length:456 start_codon:yes stop_codon:yes gene_type:complete